MLTGKTATFAFYVVTENVFHIWPPIFGAAFRVSCFYDWPSEQLGTFKTGMLGCTGCNPCKTAFLAVTGRPGAQTGSTHFSSIRLRGKDTYRDRDREHSLKDRDSTESEPRLEPKKTHIERNDTIEPPNPPEICSDGRCPWRWQENRPMHP